MAKSWILRPTNQQKCFDKAKNKSKFLIAAKCRFGKTFVASEIAFTSWCAHKVLTIAGYSSLKDEWDKTIKSQYPEKSKYFEFQTLQILKTGTKRNEIIGRNRGCVLIFDEAHFGERTAKTQEIVEELQPSKILYLTATAYTDSLIMKFAKENGLEGENQYSYSIQDEFDDYFKDPKSFVEINKYTPVKITVSILQYEEVGEKNGIEIWTKMAWNRFKNELDSKGYKTILYFVKTKKEADVVEEQFKKFSDFKIDNNKFKIHNLSGSENALGDEIDETKTRAFHEDVAKAKDSIYNAKQNGDYFLIIACKRGGTGVTWKGLDCIVFYDAPDSAIDFIQKSYRCGNPEEGKSKATVYCFNKESALNVYLKVNEKEAKRRNISAKENFTNFAKCMEVYLDGKLITKDSKDFNILMQDLDKKWSLKLFDISGIDLSLYNDDGFQIKTDAEKVNKSKKDAEDELGKCKKAQEENNKKVEKAIEDESKKTENENVKKKEKIALRFIKMYHVLSYYSKMGLFDFDVDSVESYPTEIWEKIEEIFTKDQWESLLENNKTGVKAYIRRQEEKEQEDKKSAAEKKAEREIAIRTFMEGVKKDIGDPVKLTVKEVEERNSNLQTKMRNWSLFYNGLIFGTQLDGSEFAHILPLSENRHNECSINPENGLMLPHILHHAWDRGVVTFVFLDKEDGTYLKVVLLKKEDEDAEVVKLYDVSNKPISEGQKEFLIQRGIKYEA